jgi:hypothetical protein
MVLYLFPNSYLYYIDPESKDLLSLLPNVDDSIPSEDFYSLLPVLRNLGLQTMLSRTTFIKEITTNGDVKRAEELWKYLTTHWSGFQKYSACSMTAQIFCQVIQTKEWIPASFERRVELVSSVKCRPANDRDLVSSVKHIIETTNSPAGLLETFGWDKPIEVELVVQHLKNISLKNQHNLKVLHTIYEYLNGQSLKTSLDELKE